jgi:hypothetical protein
MNQIDQWMTHEDFLQEQLKAPEFRKAWKASEPSYQLKRLRIQKKLASPRPKRRSARKNSS